MEIIPPDITVVKIKRNHICSGLGTKGKKEKYPTSDRMRKGRKGHESSIAIVSHYQGQFIRMTGFI